MLCSLETHLVRQSWRQDQKGCTDQCGLESRGPDNCKRIQSTKFFPLAGPHLPCRWNDFINLFVFFSFCLLCVWQCRQKGVNKFAAVRTDTAPNQRVIMKETTNSKENVPHSIAAAESATRIDFHPKRIIKLQPMARHKRREQWRSEPIMSTCSAEHVFPGRDEWATLVRACAPAELRYRHLQRRVNGLNVANRNRIC